MDDPFPTYDSYPQFLFKEKISENLNQLVYVCYLESCNFLSYDGFVILRQLSFKPCTKIDSLKFERETTFLKANTHPLINKTIMCGKIIKSSKVKYFNILELHPYSDLYMYYRHCKINNIPITDFEKFKIIYLLTQTINEIHSNRFFHRDIKPQNIFLNFQKYPILGDFYFIKNISDIISGHYGTIGYVSPEMLKNDKYDEKTDIYSLGATIFFIIYEFPIYFFESSSKKFKKLVKNQSSFEIYQNLLKSNNEEIKQKFNFINHFLDKKNIFNNIIHNCMEVDPNTRITIKKILELLTEYGDIKFPEEFQKIQNFEMLSKNNFKSDYESIKKIKSNFSYYLLGIYHYHLFIINSNQNDEKKSIKYLEKSCKNGCNFKEHFREKDFLIKNKLNICVDLSFKDTQSITFQ